MRAREESIVRDCFSFLAHSNDKDEYQITSIYYRKNSSDAVDVLANAVDISSRTKIVAFDPYMDRDIHQRPWNFDIDYYNFKFLEAGYEILYMPFVSHISTWIDIGIMKSEDFTHPEGLQKYLLYCKQHGITQKLIYTLTMNNIENAMLKYHEVNNGYEIISSMDIGSSSIVLGHNPNAPEPYVVWECSQSQRNDYRSGSYRSRKSDAIDTFQSRCQECLNRTLQGKTILIPRKEKREYER